MKSRLARLALAGAALAAPHAAWAADDGAWSDARTSPAISALETEVAVMYSAAQAGSVVPPGARITQVHAGRAHEGSAVVRTSVCWNGTTRCVPLSGAQINTRAFAGLDASRPLYLVHVVSAWGRQYPPAFVPGNVIVWYETP